MCFWSDKLRKLCQYYVIIYINSKKLHILFRTHNQWWLGNILYLTQWEIFTIIQDWIVSNLTLISSVQCEQSFSQHKNLLTNKHTSLTLTDDNTNDDDEDLFQNNLIVLVIYPDVISVVDEC